MPKVKIETWLDIPEDSICKEGIEHEEDILNEIKWAIQRVQKGYDDRVVWSIDYYLNNMMPKWISKLRESKVGTPSSMFDEDDMQDGHPSDEAYNRADIKWKAELDKIIAGFKIAEKIEDEWIPETEDSPEWKIFNEGFEAFRKNYFSLWD